MDEHLSHILSNIQLLGEFEGAIDEGVAGNMLVITSKHELLPIPKDADFLDQGLVGEDAELEHILAAIELVEVELRGEAMHFDETVDEVDAEAQESQRNPLS